MGNSARGLRRTWDDSVLGVMPRSLPLRSGWVRRHVVSAAVALFLTRRRGRDGVLCLLRRGADRRWRARRRGSAPGRAGRRPQRRLVDRPSVAARYREDDTQGQAQRHRNGEGNRKTRRVALPPATSATTPRRPMPAEHSIHLHEGPGNGNSRCITLDPTPLAMIREFTRFAPGKGSLRFCLSSAKTSTNPC